MPHAGQRVDGDVAGRGARPRRDAACVASSPVRLRAAMIRGMSAFPPGSRWLRPWLDGEPHRLAFAAGALMLAAAATWWCCRVLGLAPGGALPAAEAHAILMTFGFMPLFFGGFLAGTGSRWLGQPPLPARQLAPAVLLQLAGWLAFLGATTLRAPAAAAAAGALAVLVAGAGQATAWWRFATRVAASARPDRAHAGVIALAGGTGLLALLAVAGGLATHDVPLARAAVRLALWVHIGCTFAAAAHRMIPFLGGSTWPAFDARRPRWLLEALAAVFVLEGTADAAGLLHGAMPAALQSARTAIEALAGAGLLGIALRWGFVQNLRIRLLAMLRVAVAWLALSFLLAAVSHGLALAGHATLGTAPLHAYSMGFLGSTMLAMVARFIAGHSGRTVAADAPLGRLFVVLQCAVAARVAGGVLAALGVAHAQVAIALAAIGWALVCVLWAGRYLPWLAAPRRSIVPPCSKTPR